MDTMQDAFNLSLADWQEWCRARSLPAYVGGQIYEWIFQKGVVDPAAFTNLSKGVRETLQRELSWELPEVDTRLKSADGSEKFLLKVAGGDLIEMVLMPYEGRATLCVSSQVGCRMGCTFCQTGKLGLKRNLSSGEILVQLLLANSFFEGRRVTNVVFMGMGEPLDNYDAVVAACRVMVDPLAFGLSKGRVTISTSGLTPEIRRLAQELPMRLAISLHTAIDEERSELMPVNRKYPLSELKAALLDYPAPKNHGITFEYVMIAGKNDTELHAKRLVHFLHGLRAKVNLIPLNHFPGIDLAPSEKEALERFQAYLSKRSIPAPIRYSRGQDVSGGCGQLAAKREEDLHKDPRLLRCERRGR